MSHAARPYPELDVVTFFYIGTRAWGKVWLARL